MSSSTLPGILAGLLAASIWGGMFVVSKVVLAVIPPFGLLSLRFVLGIAGLGLWWLVRTWLDRRHGLGAVKVPVPGRTWVWLHLVGALGYGLSLGLQFVGTRLSTASNAALVTSATPVFIFLASALLFREKLGSRRWLALGLAALGVIAVMDPAGLDLSPDKFWGNLCLFGAAVTWALYSVLVGRIGRNLPLIPVSMVALLGGLPLTLAGAVVELGQAPWGVVDGGIIGGILFLGIVSTSLAMAAWNYAFAVLPAGTASLTFFAQPLVGTFLGWLILGDQLSPLVWVGASALMAALLLAAREKPAG